MKTTENKTILNVLIVDDNYVHRELIERWVTSMGHHCEIAEDGQKAVDHLSNAPFDLVLTDMMMPNMDGLQLLNHIKGKYTDINVIAFTGYSKDYTFTDVIKAGATDFLEKPVVKEILDAKINRVIIERFMKNSFQDEIKTQQVLLDLLNLSIESKEIEELLHEFLVCITAFPWLELEPRGAAFLLDDNDDKMLELKAHHNLSAPLQTICARVPFGRCLCGRAALSGEIVFADHVDSSHDNTFEGIEAHGHYCVPIRLANNKLLGVFTLYTKAGGKQNDKVVTVLKAAGKALAKIIKNRQIESVIAAQEHLFKSMTDSVLDAIIIMDNHGLISFWNPAAEKLFGYSPEEALGKNLHEILASERHLTQYMPALKEFSHSGQGNAIGKTIEVHALCKSGKEIPVELSLSSMVIKGAWQAVGIVRDISARVELEKEKEELNQQLRQAHKMEAIGTLAGGIAHDFNNILGAIIGFADMAMEDVQAESQTHKDLERILAAGNRAKELVSQILTFSRREEEKLIPVKIHLTLKEALKMLRASIPANIEIQQDIDANCNSVLADPTKIHQVIMNLCTNAYYAMRDKGGVMRIILKEVVIGDDGNMDMVGLKSGSYAQMSVIDTGIGMESYVVDRIFEPFYTTKPQGEGTGMGMSVVHGIISGLGGVINVKSEPGRGSTFEVYIPIISEHEDEQKAITESSTIDGGNGHILLVDDEFALTEITSRILKKLGYTLTARSSSVDALEAFKTQPDKFDLVITDLAMPNMTGLDMAIEILKLKPQLPIIMLTGFVDSRTSEYAFKIGIKKIINKPVSPYDIALTVKQLLQRSQR